MKKILCLALLCSVVLCSCSVVKYEFTSTDGDVRVAFVEPSYKVEQLQSDIPSQSAFSVEMCKNEVEGGQIILRNSFGEIRNAAISVSSLFDGENIIDASRIKVYRERYIKIPLLDGSPAYPDALIPMEYADLNSHTAAQGENLPYYIELATTPDDIAGVYTGTATVTYDEGVAEIPLTFHIHDIVIPTKPSTVMDLWGPSGIETIYKDKNINAREMLYHFALDYRFSISNITSDATTPEIYLKNILPYASMEKVTVFSAPVYGEWYTAENGYPAYRFDVEKMQRLISILRENNILEKACFSVFDEPTSSEQIENLKLFTEELHAIDPEANSTCALAFNPDLLPDGLDTWVLSWQSVKKDIVDKIESNGNTAWRYGTEETLIGGNDLVEAKIRFWHQHELGITGYLQWAGDNFTTYNTITGERRLKTDDLWENPYFFLPVEDYPMYYEGGDGFLLYPGLEGDGIINRNILVPTIRIAGLRDGSEDYELLCLRRAQIEEQISEYGISDSADSFMALYYDAVNDITTSPAGKTVSNFERYASMRKQLLHDIDENSNVLVSVGKSDVFSKRDIRVIAPQGSTVLVNGENVAQDGFVCETTVSVTSAQSKINVSVNGNEHIITVYPKLLISEKSVVSFADTDDILAVNRKLSPDAVSVENGALTVQLQNGTDAFTLPQSAITDSNLSAIGNFLLLDITNLSDEDLSSIEFTFSSGSSRGSISADNIVEAGARKTVYFDFSGCDVKPEDVVRITFILAKNAKFTINDIKTVNIY